MPSGVLSGWRFATYKKSIELALLVLRILGIAKHLSKIKPTLNLILCPQYAVAKSHT